MTVTAGEIATHVGDKKSVKVDPIALLLGWRACMSSPRPSDWEAIVENLLQDTDAALGGPGWQVERQANMKQSIEKNRAITFRAGLEALRYSSSALIEMLDTTINDANEATIDQKVAALGGGDADLIEVLDDALVSVVDERNAYIETVGLEIGEASFKVK